MLFFKIENNKVVDVSEKSQQGYVCRLDFATLEQAANVATMASAYTTQLHIAIDKGSNVSPRFDVIRCPQVGDKVSQGFNGDYYPDGEIVSISSTLKVIKTSLGSKYYRKGNSGVWKMGNTWSLVQGHHNDRNPEI